MQETGRLQLGYQVAAMVVTMGIAIAWGTLMGWVVNKCNPFNMPPLMPVEMFDDGPWWVG